MRNRLPNHALLSCQSVVGRHRIFQVSALVLSLSVVGGLLAYSDFLPYVTDGNESFSAYMHAKNMRMFGVREAIGLTDESNSPQTVAHPYVYTHQGNFPRLASFVLLWFGIDRIEWHIALITLVVGGLTVYFAFAVFSRAADEAFALIACVVLWTDYILFVQWQVNTFRVWHAFFFFLSLWCVQVIGESNKRRIGGVLLLTSVGVFYFELAFAVFVAGFAGFYALLLHRRELGYVFRIVANITTGGILSMATLTAQIFAYLGVERGIDDFRFTYLSRNVAGALNAARAETVRFFVKNHIVYWDNFREKAKVLSWATFLEEIAPNVLEVITPLLVLLVGTVAVAVVLRDLEGPLSAAGRALARLGQYRRVRGPSAPRQSHDARRVDRSLALRPSVGYSLRPRRVGKDESIRRAGPALPGLMSGLLKWTALVAVSYCATSLVAGEGRPWSKEEVVGFPSQIWGPVGPRKVGVSIAMTLLLAKAVTGTWLGFARMSGLRVGLTASLVAIVALYMRHHEGLYRDLALWWPYVQDGLSPKLLQAALLAAFFLAACLVLTGNVCGVPGQPTTSTHGILAYVAAGMTAFALTYVIFPGYVESAYLVRYNPLPVFVTDVVIALAFYVVLVCVRQSWRATRQGFGSAAVLCLTSMFLLGFGGWYWVRLQALYVQAAPPTAMLFMKRFASPAFKGASFVSDNYATPISYFTGQWAYRDDTMPWGKVVWANAAWMRESSGKYIWFADRDRNDEYLRPTYYLCRFNPGVGTITRALSRPYDRRIRNCSRKAIFEESLAGHGEFRHQIVDYDRTWRDDWAIIKLDPNTRLAPEYWFGPDDQ